MPEYRVAVVTGAARRVVRTMALELAARGYALAVHYHSSTPAEVDETLAACRDCALGALCGRCHGLARQPTGNLHAPSPLNCTQALARRQALIERKLASPESLPLNAHLATLHRRLESDATRLPA